MTSASETDQRKRPAESPPRKSLDARAQQARVAAAFRSGRRRVGTSLGLSAIALIWLMAAIYYFLLPPVYISRWSLILPAANSGSSVTLETIGQASTNPGQPFGSVQLSPKVIYREIATSDQVRSRAADSIGISPQKFGRVRIRLIDETSLMLFQISGGTPDDAQAKGRALIGALNAQLDVLRRDELDKRAQLMRDNLQIYQTNLDRSRERILDFQRATGLLSADQFKEAAATAEALRRKLAERRAEQEKVGAEQRRLVERVGLAPEVAAVGLRLSSEPGFARLASTFAEGTAQTHENMLRYGPNHPAMSAAQMKRDGALSEIERIAREQDASVTRSELHRLVLLVSGAPQADLLRAIVTGEALNAGLSREIEALTTEVRRSDLEVARMGADAARLESMRKDHLVAEAVFTSAAARLDTNRTDLYSSYPLVQILAEPDLPESRTQPRLSYAIAAGAVGTLLVLLAWGAAWVGASFSRRRSKSG